MISRQSTPGVRGLAASLLCAFVLIAFPLVPLVLATDQQIDLDKNAVNGAESKVSTKVLQTYPVKIENTVLNNAAGAYNFVWPGAGPGGFSSFVTAGPGVGTIWIWTTVYQVYNIQSPVTFSPSRTLQVYGAPSTGIQQPAPTTSTFTAPGKSIFPSSVTISDASLSSSLITFFSPEKTVAACGFDCAPGECELFLENRSGSTATVSAQQLGCCNEPHQLICDGECKSYLTDTSNCGGCGVACASDELCSDGACVCPAGLTQCGGGCIDLQADPANCGACGNVCAADEFCGNGACQCDPGLTQCGSGCTDLMTDTSNCGACGSVCPIGGFCAGGACACPAGQIACGGRCTDPLTDPLNCGGCGNSCGTDAICTAGSCSDCRPPRDTACGNTCVNLHTDPNNCGACGNVCDFSNCPSTGQGTCSQGQSCVCSPATVTSGSSSSSLRFRPVRRSPVTSTVLADPAPVLAAPQPVLASAPSTAPAGVSSNVVSPAAASVVEAPVCDLAPIEQVIPAGGVYTQTHTGGRFGKEIQTSVAITVNGQVVAQGPCAQVIPITNVDTSGVILSPIAVDTTDTSGDGLCQPGESRCDYRITIANLGDTACLDPQATLSSPPDQFNSNTIPFLNNSSAYPGLPPYPGDGVPLDRKTNTVAFAIAPTLDQQPDVGRPFLMSVTCSNRPAPVEMALTLGIGRSCGPNDIDGETYDRLDGLQSPVRARLVAEGNPVNYSTGSFNYGSTVPLKIALACGGQILDDSQINPNPQIVALVHETLGPQSLLGINGENNANPDDPGFSCTSSGCDYQLRTDPLPAGRYVIGLRMPDSRIFQAGFTISP